MVPTSEASLAARPSAVGRIQGIGVPELFHELSRSCRTGTLRLRRAGAVTEVWFEDGRIVHALSDDPNDRLGTILLRERKITLDQLGPGGHTPETEEALCSRLLDAGALTRREMDRVILARVRAIVATTFQWEDGDYEFHDRPAAECPTRIETATAELIIDGVRRCRSFQVMRRSVGSPQTRYRRAADCVDRLDGLSLIEAERLVLESLQSGPRSVEAVCAEVYLSDFEVYQALWALRILRATEVVDHIVGADVRGSGRLEQDEFVGVLVRLCREGETGVLHVSRGGVDRSFHIREGRCVFATSSNPDDGLVAHVFRRGVISLKDREEVGRRMLTNKRVGAILLDLGVLDPLDIERMVREQLTEIVNDTVRWQSGEFWFAPGELPTLEEITLVSSIEDLVVQSVRTVSAWSRVLRGIGGSEARIELAPSYLDVLDRMTMGGDEWDIVALLAKPRSVREVCRASGLGDFSVCQTLWSLHLLGAVTHAAAGAPADVEVQPVQVEASASAAVERMPEPEPSVEPPAATVIETKLEEPEPPAVVIAEPPAEQPYAEAPAQVELSPMISEDDARPAETAVLSVAPFLPQPERAQAHEDSALSDPAAAEPSQEPAFELGTPGCDTEPYMEEQRPMKPRLTEEDRRALDPSTEREIEWLNACQQTVYRIVRAEVGAGAANFIRFCGEKLPDGFGAVFAHVELEDDGSWDVPALRAGLRRERPGELHAGFQRLIDKELEMVQVHLGPERAAALRRKIGDLENVHMS